jgi:hypothetical protein
MEAYKLILDAVAALKDETDATKVSAADKTYFTAAYEQFNADYTQGKKNADDALALVVKREEGFARDGEIAAFERQIADINKKLTDLNAKKTTDSTSLATKRTERE